jgi:hypothetical protein
MWDKGPGRKSSGPDRQALADDLRGRVYALASAAEKPTGRTLPRPAAPSAMRIY